VPALDLARHRIQQIVGVAVNLRSALEHKLSGIGRVGPLMKVVQRRREAPEAGAVKTLGVKAPWLGRRRADPYLQ
jgi:hypothetical protein